MRELQLIQLDAFTDRPLGGNPCAVVLDACELSAKEMQAIAVEMNLAETAFVVHTDKADVGARYFTPAREIPLAGHPTIATITALIETGRITLEGDSTHITLELPAGVIPVRIDRAKQGAPPRVVMSQIRPEFARTYEAAEVLPALGLASADLLPGVRIQTVSTGTPFLMIPLASLEALGRATLEISAFRRLREAGDFVSPHLFCPLSVTGSDATFARNLDVPPDLCEDPFTGSATGAMGAYLWRYGLIAEPCFRAEQGHWMGRPGCAEVEVVGPRDAIETVKVGGTAVPVLRGVLSV